jgi:hypothetical protein
MCFLSCEILHHKRVSVSACSIVALSITIFLLFGTYALNAIILDFSADVFIHFITLHYRQITHKLPLVSQ